jgi:hypothetical protein
MTPSWKATFQSECAGGAINRLKIARGMGARNESGGQTLSVNTTPFQGVCLGHIPAVAHLEAVLRPSSWPAEAVLIWIYTYRFVNRFVGI